MQAPVVNDAPRGDEQVVCHFLRRHGGDELPSRLTFLQQSLKDILHIASLGDKELVVAGIQLLYRFDAHIQVVLRIDFEIIHNIIPDRSRRLKVPEFLVKKTVGLLVHLHENVAFGGEVIIKGTYGDTGSTANFSDGNVLQGVLLHQLNGTFEQVAFGLDALQLS
ncbi:hypothetical protein D3C75_700610 [compost metagenome]